MYQIIQPGAKKDKPNILKNFKFENNIPTTTNKFLNASLNSAIRLKYID